MVCDVEAKAMLRWQLHPQLPIPLPIRSRYMYTHLHFKCSTILSQLNEERGERICYNPVDHCTGCYLLWSIRLGRYVELYKVTLICIIHINTVKVHNVHKYL